jgi:thioester reductase-like protein
VKTAIFRPGLMCGDGMIGAPNPSDAVTLLIKACVTLGVAPDSPMRINSTSVGYGARGLVALGAEKPGNIWHLVHDTPTLMTDVFRLLPECGYAVSLLAYDEWVARLRAAADGTELAPLIGYFTPDFPEETTRRVFESTATRTALAARGVVHPEINSDFWRANIRGMAKTGVLPPPTQVREAS